MSSASSRNATRPVTTASTPSARPAACGSTAESLKREALVRGATRTAFAAARRLIVSSVNPSATSSFAPLSAAKGSTATEANSALGL